MRSWVAAALAAAALIPGPGARAAADPLRPRQYALDMMRVGQAWTFSRGAGVVIAVLDTGVDLAHEDLRGRIVAGHDFVDGDELPQDENGHGTHVAGIAAASADNGIGVAGVAPAASIMPMRVLDKSGTGTEAAVAAAVDASVLRARGFGMRLVINLSLTDLATGVRTQGRRLEQALARAWRSGAVVVAAAGNAGLPFTEYPAAGVHVLAVGATDSSDRRASFSNRGPVIVAPGEGIVSTYYDPKQPLEHGSYAIGGGTSMSAPQVSGIAALLLSAGMDNKTVVDRIVQTADDLGLPGPDPDYGYGRVNAARAIGAPGFGLPAGLPAPVSRPAAGTFQEIKVGAGAPPGSRPVLPAVALVVLAAGAVWVFRPRRALGPPGPLPSAPIWPPP